MPGSRHRSLDGTDVPHFQPRPAGRDAGDAGRGLLAVLEKGRRGRERLELEREKLARRKVPLKNLSESKVEEGSLGRARQTIGFKQGIDQETAKRISKDIRDGGFKKVQVQIQGEELRVTSPSRDTLQEVIETYPVRLSMHTIRQMRISKNIAYQYAPFIEELDPVGQVNTWVGQFHQGLLEQMYRNRVIFLLNMSCPVYCRFCFRKHKDSRNQANPTTADVQRAVEYVGDSPNIKEIVITGGDPFLNKKNMLTAIDGDEIQLPQASADAAADDAPAVAPPAVALAAVGLEELVEALHGRIQAFVGLSGVGKSSLLNLIARERLAIVDPTPGVTRDRLSVVVTLEAPDGNGPEKPVELTDTGGFGVYTAEGGRYDEVGADLRRQAKKIVDLATEFESSMVATGTTPLPLPTRTPIPVTEVEPLLAKGAPTRRSSRPSPSRSSSTPSSMSIRLVSEFFNIESMTFPSRVLTAR